MRVTCEDGTEYDAEYIIVTPSLGFLKENYKSMFTPELPHKKINAIEGLSIGTVGKIFLKFEKRWWPEECTGYCLIWPEHGDSLDFTEGPRHVSNKES